MRVNGGSVFTSPKSGASPLSFGSQIKLLKVKSDNSLGAGEKYHGKLGKIITQYITDT